MNRYRDENSQSILKKKNVGSTPYDEACNEAYTCPAPQDIRADMQRVAWHLAQPREITALLQ